MSTLSDGSPIQFPHTSRASGAVSVRVGYLWRPRLRVSAFSSGSVKFRNDHGIPRTIAMLFARHQFLDMSPSVRTTAVLASFEVDGLHIGGGPSWNTVRGGRLAAGASPS